MNIQSPQSSHKDICRNTRVQQSTFCFQKMGNYLHKHTETVSGQILNIISTEWLCKTFAALRRRLNFALFQNSLPGLTAWPRSWGCSSICSMAGLLKLFMICTGFGSGSKPFLLFLISKEEKKKSVRRRRKQWIHLNPSSYNGNIHISSATEK